MENFEHDPIDERPDSHRAAENDAINAILARQGDTIAFRQLAEIGLSRRSVRRRVAASLLYPVWGNVYSGRPLPLLGKGWDWATLLSGGPHAALADVTAAAVHDLTKTRPRDGRHIVELGDGRRSADPERIRRHRTDHLPGRDIVNIDGLRCTSVARTLLDCAAHVDRERLDDMLDRTVLLRTFNSHALERVLNDQPRARGARRLLGAIARLDDTAGRHRSLLERRATALIRESTVITTPAVNAHVGGFESDLWWHPTRAMVEADGRDFHRSPAQIQRDEEREIAYLALGFVIFRVRWQQVVYERARTLGRIERFVLANTAPPVPGVTGRLVF